MKDRKAYIVKGSEDGNIGVCTSIRKAVDAAVDYVLQTADVLPEDLAERKKALAKEVKDKGFCAFHKSDLYGLASTSFDVQAEVEEFVLDARC